MFQPLQIQDVMTPLPQGIEVDLTLAAAAERMKELGCRHIPVLRQQQLVGVLSKRDLELAAGVGAPLQTVSVGVAMTPGPFVVPPTTPFRDVVREMKARKIGSAIVEDGDHIVGIFTITDALGLLMHALDVEGAVPRRSMFPSEVRQRLLNEHHMLGKMAAAAQTEAERALTGTFEAEEALKRHAAELYSALLRHIELEDEILVPLLEEIPVSGPIRAGVLKDKHDRQRLQLHLAQGGLEHADTEHLARSLARLSRQLLELAQQQEAGILSPRVLHDDVVQRDAAGG